MARIDTPLITLENAGAYRSNRWLVRGVDLSIRSGEIVTLIGPNGSGKSTTAKMALGVLKPDEGTAEQRSELVTSYVPQRIEVDWSLPLTVARFMRLTNTIADKDIDFALEATGVLSIRNNDVQTLSGGEFQRVLLARAMARKPDLLVLDEPAQGVDFPGEIALYGLVKTIRDELNCGVLLISHDLHLVMAETDRVLCLNGHVCCSGTPTSVASNKHYQDLFGPRSHASLAVYEHSHDHMHLPDGRVRHADGTITDHCHPDDGHHHEVEDHNAG